MSELSRRQLLTMVAGTAAAGAAGLLLPAPAAQAHGTLTHSTTIDGQATVYEVSGALAGFDYNPTFLGRLNTWLEFWYLNTPIAYLKPLRVWTDGAHYDGRVSAAHNSGRGFDLTRIYASVNGTLTKVFNGRYDQWSTASSSVVIDTRRKYWATAASAHHHFRNVLTYAYNADHHNHIHIDNLVSGTGNSSFDSTSKAQVVSVQSCCRYIWGRSTSVDGVWGPQTSADSTAVLRSIGRTSGSITTQSNWLAFNKASMRKGYGLAP